ncbi:hypothetical protein GCK32_018894, partial [Trichostrongylus colubriformis]
IEPRKKEKLSAEAAGEQKKPKREKSLQNAVEEPQTKDLKSGPLHKKGAAALVAKVKGRKKSRSESISMDEIMYPSAQRKTKGRKVISSAED